MPLAATSNVLPGAGDDAGEPELPAVTVAVPVLDEAPRLAACLEAVSAQRYPWIVEVLVVDGGSRDRTREVARSFADVRVIDNPRRSRPAGLNIALGEAAGEIFVRVDARTLIAADYVARCVDALLHSGATVVGGPMRVEGQGALGRGIAAAMSSRLGAGPARFRRRRPERGYTDTVYLGAFRTEALRGLGGYDEGFGGNEDAELAWRGTRAEGIWLDPAISSTYAVREGLGALFCQYRRYGVRRLGTMLKHPASISFRQLAVPLLFAGFASPWRRAVLATYAAVVVARGAPEVVRDPAAGLVFVAALPTMHAGWGVGFLEGALRQIGRRPPASA